MYDVVNLYSQGKKEKKKAQKCSVDMFLPFTVKLQCKWPSSANLLPPSQTSTTLKVFTL